MSGIVGPVPRGSESGATGRIRGRPGPADLVEAVLAAVGSVPVGRVTTYGRVAALVRGDVARGSPRAVGQVLARHGDGTDWFRVLHADGRLPPEAAVAAAALRAEGIEVREGRVTPLTRWLWPDGS